MTHIHKHITLYQLNWAVMSELRYGKEQELFFLFKVVLYCLTTSQGQHQIPLMGKLLDKAAVLCGNYSDEAYLPCCMKV